MNTSGNRSRVRTRDVQKQGGATAQEPTLMKIGVLAEESAWEKPGLSSDLRADLSSIGEVEQVPPLPGFLAHPSSRCWVLTKISKQSNIGGRKGARTFLVQWTKGGSLTFKKLVLDVLPLSESRSESFEIQTRGCSLANSEKGEKSVKFAPGCLGHVGN